jgi:hypothetical protein
MGQSPSIVALLYFYDIIKLKTFPSYQPRGENVEKIAPSVSRMESLKWWVLLLLALVVVDDLTSGPIFWAISVASRPAGLVSAFVVSVVFQLWLLKATLSKTPSARAAKVLVKLRLDRRPELKGREDRLIRRASSGAGSLAMTLLFGAIIPVIALRNRLGFRDTAWFKAYAVFLVVLYASEFAAIHGGYGIGGGVHNGAWWLWRTFA